MELGLDLPKTGFSFDNCARNATLDKMGLKPPVPTKTGTTIVGVMFKDGVVIGCDSRATAGDLIADKHCIKLHCLSSNIYACGAGTAADLDQVASMLASNLKLLELNTGRKPRVVSALRIAKQHLFRYQGYIGAYMIIAGVDAYGAHMYSVHAHGSSTVLPFLAEGSGSLAAMGILEKHFKLDLSQEQAVELVKNALMGGMHHDLSSGNSLRYAIIRKDGTQTFGPEVPEFCQGPPKDRQYRYPKGSSTVLKTKQIKFDVVESMEM